MIKASMTAFVLLTQSPWISKLKMKSLASTNESPGLTQIRSNSETRAVRRHRLLPNWASLDMLNNNALPTTMVSTKDNCIAHLSFVLGFLIARFGFALLYLASFGLLTSLRLCILRCNPPIITHFPYPEAFSLIKYIPGILFGFWVIRSWSIRDFDAGVTVINISFLQESSLVLCPSRSCVTKCCSRSWSQMLSLQLQAVFSSPLSLSRKKSCIIPEI